MEPCSSSSQEAGSILHSVNLVGLVTYHGQLNIVGATVYQGPASASRAYTLCSGSQTPEVAICTSSCQPTAEWEIMGRAFQVRSPYIANTKWYDNWPKNHERDPPSPTQVRITIKPSSRLVSNNQCSLHSVLGRLLIRLKPTIVWCQMLCI